MHENEKGKVRTEYKLDESVYSHIYDAVIDSSKTDSKDSFELYLAAKLFGLTNIHIIDAIKPKKDGKINVKYNLAYLKKGLKIMVRISDNLNKVLFTNGQEHYILNNGHQDIIESIKEKFIRHVINYKNSFYLVTSKDYDRDIDIIHAEHKDENYYFDRFIEPGLLQCYDSNVVEDLNDFNKERNVMQTLMKIGD